MRVIVRGVAANLSPQEYRLALYLMFDNERVVSQQKLAGHLQSVHSERESNAIEILVARARGKLPTALIETRVSTLISGTFRFHPMPIQPLPPAERHQPASLARGQNGLRAIQSDTTGSSHHLNGGRGLNQNDLGRRTITQFVDTLFVRGISHQRQKIFPSGKG